MLHTKELEIVFISIDIKALYSFKLLNKDILYLVKVSRKLSMKLFGNLRLRIN